MIIIMEGLWSLGKTTVGNFLSKNGLTFIDEPDHYKENIGQSIDLDKWYIQSFLKKARLSKRYRHIFYERGLSSTLAYICASHGNTDCLTRYKRYIADYTSIFPTSPTCIILSASIADYMKRALTIKDQRIRDFVTQNPRFIKEYAYYLKMVSLDLYGKKYTKIITTYINGNFLPKQVIFSQLKEIISEKN